ncbi:MAG: hypothetical protein ACI4RO_04870 [Candidatus Scatosoma sp.]
MVKRGFRAAGLALAFLCVAALFLPVFGRESVAEERYLTEWSDGTRTSENYDGAYRALQGLTSAGNVLLLRDKRTGEIAGSDELRSAVAVFETGTLGQLYEMRPSLNRIERAALWKEYGGRVYCDLDLYRWTGERVERAASCVGEEFVLLAGGVSSSVLAESGAETLFVKKDAEIGSSALTGTAVKEIVAEAPYAAEEGALFLDTSGGRRLIAAVPSATDLFVGDCGFADEGALLCCGEIVSLSLPFLGNASSSEFTGYAGEFAFLFRSAGKYSVPACLRRVRVRGGEMISHAFFSCPFVEEVNACGVDPEKIASDAFSDLRSLRLLHTPQADVLLPGGFTSYVAPCGCTVYKRVGV